MSTNISVLHIDDEDSFLSLLRTAIQRKYKNINVDSVDDPHQALERLDTRSYDVIICDYQMPIMNGLELLVELRNRENTTPFIILTGKGREEIIIQALNLGADYYLQKGGNFRSLIRELVHYLVKAFEREQVNRERKQAEKRYRELFNSMNSGVAVYEVKDDGNTFVFRDFNKGAEKIDNIKKEALIGKSVVEKFPGIKKFGLLEVFKQVWKTGKPMRHPIALYKDNRIDGWRENYVYRLPTGEIVTVYEDITPRKQLEESLKCERDRAREYLDVARVMILALNEEGEVMLVNKKGCELLGHEEQDIVGKNWFDSFLPEKEKFEVKKVFQKMMSGEIGPDTYYENIVLTKHGEEKFIAWNNNILQDGVGTIIGTLSSGEDISERKRAEDQLKRQKEELSQFTHFMTHDIKNSLQIIDGHAQLHEEDSDKSHIEKILKQSDYIKKLLNKSLALADAGHIIMKTDTVELNLLVEEVARVTIPGNIAFSRDKLPVSFLCDQDKLAQVFKNLFDNAIIHGEPTRIEVKHAISGKIKSLLIINDGKTIPVEIRDRIFEQGFTTRKNSTGYGLVIVKKLVEAHDWQINLCSIPEATIFQIDY